MFRHYSWDLIITFRLPCSCVAAKYYRSSRSVALPLPGSYRDRSQEICYSCRCSNGCDYPSHSELNRLALKRLSSSLTSEAENFIKIGTMSTNSTQNSSARSNQGGLRSFFNKLRKQSDNVQMSHNTQVGLILRTRG